MKMSLSLLHTALLRPGVPSHSESMHSQNHPDCQIFHTLLTTLQHIDFPLVLNGLIQGHIHWLCFTGAVPGRITTDAYWFQVCRVVLGKVSGSRLYVNLGIFQYL